jgi:hypothetical protein
MACMTVDTSKGFENLVSMVVESFKVPIADRNSTRSSSLVQQGAVLMMSRFLTDSFSPLTTTLESGKSTMSVARARSLFQRRM